MCCTLGPARLSNTVIYSGHAVRNGLSVTTLAYQNRATSRGPNAMILPIPTDTPMGPENIVDTREGRWFLSDLDTSTRQRQRSTLKSAPLLGSARSAQVFDSGSYTVVLATDAASISEALDRVPENKRPRVAPSFFVEYGRLYPGWPIAVCCWSGEIEAEPLLWWYAPKFPDWLFFPTVDAHDGTAPAAGDVKTDHVIIWDDPSGPFTPWYRAELPSSISQLIAPKLDASRPNGMLPNGDFWLHGSRLQRMFPTGAFPQ